MQTFLGLELDLDPLKFTETFRRGAIKSDKDFASERGSSTESLDGGLSFSSWVFQLCECQCWYNRTLKRKQSSFGEESLSNIFPGQLELNALLWPPNKESIIIIYHSWLLLIAQYNKIELHKSLYNEACGWSCLRAGGRLDSLVHFCLVLWLRDATWVSEHGDWDMWRAQSCQHHPGITGEAFSILVMLDFKGDGSAV